MYAQDSVYHMTILKWILSDFIAFKVGNCSTKNAWLTMRAGNGENP